ncbi:MAG: hypothetical protein ABIG60_04395 [Patescibacteria group bacterium]
MDNKGVNFLPQELKPKEKKVKNKEQPMDFVHPAKEQEVVIDQKKPAKKNFLGIFGRKKEKKSTKDKQVISKTAQAHQDVLQSLKNSSFAKASTDAKAMVDKMEDKPADSENTVNDKKVVDDKINFIKADKSNSESTPTVQSIENKIDDKKKEEKTRPIPLSGIGGQEKKESFFKKIFGKKNKKSKASSASSTSNSPTPIGKQKDDVEKIENNVKEFKSDLLETNLIKGKSLQQFDIKKLVITQIVGVSIGVVIVVGAYVYLKFYAASDGGILANKELLQKESELNQLKQTVTNLGDFRAKALEVQKLMKQHVYWTQLFTYLEEHTLPGVYYNRFNGNTSGKYTLEGKAENFDDFIKQMALWQENDPYTQSVFFEGANMKQEETRSRSGNQNDTETKSFVEFSINLEVDKNLFYFKE